MEPALPVWLIGAGHMGRALLKSWQAAGLVSRSAPAHVVEPNLSPALQAMVEAGSARLETAFEPAPRLVVLAVKPQSLDGVAPTLKRVAGEGSLLVSVVAGCTIATLAKAAGWSDGTASIVRAMPNTPAAVGQGATAAYVPGGVAAPQRPLAAPYLEAAGKLFWVESEADIDAVTAVSGSGPAYVFALTEALAAAGVKAGLAEDVAAGLARQTVIGAAALMAAGDEAPAALRKSVTSPGGTTEAALKVLLGDPGLEGLMEETVLAALARARDLGG